MNFDFPVDLVYTFVDGSDPEWRKKKNNLALKLGIVKNEELNGECRYDNNDELKFSLRSVDKYLNWVNNIYIITDNQVPKWLNINNKKIKIIDHKDIMPKDALPCFNSNAIEHCMSNISELSEYFIYSNDDFFFFKKVNKEDFFYFESDNIKIKNYYDKPLKHNSCAFYEMITNAEKLIKCLYPTFTIKASQAHCQLCLNKTEIKNAQILFKEQINKTIHDHFRSFQDVSFFIYQLYMSCRGVTKDIIIKKNFGHFPFNIFNMIFGRYEKITGYVEPGTKKFKYLKTFLKKHNCKMFCINDSEQCERKDAYLIKNVLSELYPEKSQFEL